MTGPSLWPMEIALDRHIPAETVALRCAEVFGVDPGRVMVVPDAAAFFMVDQYNDHHDVLCAYSAATGAMVSLLSLHPKPALEGFDPVRWAQRFCAAVPCRCLLPPEGCGPWDPARWRLVDESGRIRRVAIAPQADERHFVLATYGEELAPPI
ncbi:MAG TPA: hypothetical protein VGE07_28845 [Herpetosiphonaceae bacterium]